MSRNPMGHEDIIETLGEKTIRQGKVEDLFNLVSKTLEHSESLTMSFRKAADGIWLYE